MKPLLIFVLATTLLSSLVSFAQGNTHHIVSDVDDTVKATHVGFKLAAGFNGIFRHQGFVAMPELFQGMAEHSKSLSFISGSPKSIRFKLNYFLKSREFPAHTLYLRDWNKEKDQSAYKTNRLEALATALSGSFILIGDDTEADPDIYEQFAKEHPGRVLAIYIHRITGRSIPQGQRPIFTSLDIAAWELTEGRLSSESFKKTAAFITQPLEDTQLIPSYGICPDQAPGEDLLPPALIDPELRALQDKVAEMIGDLCSKRQ